MTTTSARPSTQGAPARGRITERLLGFVRAELPFVVVGGAVALFLLLVTLRLPWAEDFTLHLSVLRRLLDDPFDPGNPVVDQSTGTAYYSPYTVGLALIGKPLGLSAYTLYKLGAVADILLLISGLHRFIRTLSKARWAPALALAGLLFWWGTDVIAWSGFLSLVSLSDTTAYPSTLATALTFHLWASLNNAERDPRRPLRMARLGAALGVIVLIHQFTGIGAVVGCVAVLVSRHKDLLGAGVKVAAKAVGAGAAGLIVVIAVWPYDHLWQDGQSQLDILDPIHQPLYAHMVRWYGLGLLGVVALGIRWWRNKTDVLALLFLGTGLVVAYGWASHHWSYGRSWPMVMFALQAALAIAVAEAPRGLWRWAWPVPVAAFTALGLFAQSGAFLYVLPSSTQSSLSRALNGTPLGTRYGLDDMPHLDWLNPYLKPTDVVAADWPYAQYLAAAHGAYNMTEPWYLPEIPLSEKRRTDADVATLFAPGTSPATRVALLRQYHVNWVLLAPGEGALPHGFPAVPAAQGDGYRLFRIVL